jgi:hypothetical protein
MPESFDRCVSAGGQVRTKTLKGDKYLHICYKDGKAYPGYVKTKQDSGAKSKNKYTGVLTHGK